MAIDLNTVTRIRRPRERSELALAPGEAYLAGGTWLYSEPQATVTGLVDLQGLDWPALEVAPAGLTIAATCTLTELVNLPPQPGWSAQPLFGQCVNSLVASFKVWHTATVGGNLCTALPAGALIALTAALDATALLWSAGDAERALPVSELVVGAQHTALQPGEVLRSVRIADGALRARTAYRRIALSSLGRSGSLVIGRLDDGGAAVFTVTAATPRPRQLRYPELPAADALATDLAGFDWYDDPHGSPAWRAHVTALLAEEIRQELLGGSRS